MAPDKKEREVVLERELPFARELVWKAITDPEHMRRWWGPDGFTIEDPKNDLRIGGIWSFVMVGPDGARYRNHSVFKEIAPPSRLVFDHGDGKSVWFEASITLHDTGKGTRVVLRQLYANEQFRDEVVEKFGAIEGGRQHLAKMEAYVREHLAPHE